MFIRCSRFLSLIFLPTIYHRHILLPLLVWNKGLIWSVAHVNASWNTSSHAWVHEFAWFNTPVTCCYYSGKNIVAPRTQEARDSRRLCYWKIPQMVEPLWAKLRPYREMVLGEPRTNKKSWTLHCGCMTTWASSWPQNSDWQRYPCLIFQQYTQDPIHLLRKMLQQYTSNFDSHWSTGLMFSMICLHFSWNE